MSPARIWVDTDPTLGKPLSDVDDALALHFLAREGVLAGISSVFGNAPLSVTHPFACLLGSRFRVRVHRGAAGPGDTDTPAVEALCAHTGTVLAIGPCTNIAAALDRGARWERLIVLGGTDRRLPNLRPLHTTELNFALDPDAAERTLRATTHLVPMEPCREVWVDATHLDRLPDWLGEGCHPWLATAPLRHGRRAFHPWDVLPAVWAVDPSPFTVQSRSVTLRRRPGRAGYVRYGAPAASPVQVVSGVDATRLTRRWMATSGQGES